MIDESTKAWTINAADELAIRNGCKFDPVVGGYAVWWIERYCNLYEGAFAGEPMRLRGLHSEPIDKWSIEDEYDDKQALQRASHYILNRNNGDAVDWQYECTMRMFGWVRWSDKWKRWVRRHKFASIWVAKKNKKTPTMSAWALYSLCGDGEEGQKVFQISKDAKQVRANAAKHVFEMVRASPELMAECKLNLVEMSVQHIPTRSIYMPLSSSGSHNQKSKEGLNGSGYVDETHVVDRQMIQRTSRMGISREEPIFAEFSTAGNDPDSYGKERFDYAIAVAAGTIEDDSIMVAIHAAPQELTDEELADDPIKYGKMANPAWGHTIDEKEYLDDYQRSKVSASALLDFKMYRLNVWQNSASPWIKPEHWGRCVDDFTADDLLGQECYAALDLSSVSDFTSLCLCFPDSLGQHRFLWWYWLPERTAREYQDKMPIQNWLADSRCNLQLTDGERVHYGHIKDTFRELALQYEINELCYDRWNAEQVTQEMSEGETDAEGNIVEHGTGIPRVDFPQGIKTFNEPTKQFEVAVIDGDIRHNNDPLTAWMIGNATIKPDANGNYKPIKPGKDSVKKIDGVITAIMARARAVIREDSDAGGLILL